MNKSLPEWLPPAPMLLRSGIPALALALIVALAISSGCSSSASKRPQPGAEAVLRDISPTLRGLIGSMTTLRGRTPLLVSGYGIVVGLDGTGSADMAVNVRAFMEREMAANGVGQISKGFGAISPSQMLNDPNTAIVQVQAAIPPGAPVGTTFDVLVRALPGTSTTSLEGGRLWTTDLFRGNFIPGGRTSKTLAHAAGQIFINPFADPARGDADTISRTTGRVLDGGRVIEPLDLILVLDNPSHARARSIVSAINARFPQNSDDRQPIARGKSEEIIELNVPARYRRDTSRFIELLMHTRVDQTFPQEWALRFARALREQPELATPLSWAMRAIGPASLPELRRLYDYSELTPRLAALQAGAGLRDPLVEPHLIELATNGPPALRTRAIKLLGQLDPDPSTNLALRKLLDSEELDVRVTAYEALRRRFDPAITQTPIEDKFILNVAPFGEPMVYVTQQGTPRIVVFGEGAQIAHPVFVSAWDDRLMLTSDDSADDLRIYYRDYRTDKTTTGPIKAALPAFIKYLAHTSTPESPAPGLGLTYSEVVGALHEIWKADGFPGVFVAEQDRLIADLLRSTRTLSTVDRPETSHDSGKPDQTFTPQTPIITPASSDRPRTYVVPLKKPSTAGSPG